LSRDNLGGSATAGIRAASVHQRCWNLKKKTGFIIKFKEQGIWVYVTVTCKSCWQTSKFTKTDFGQVNR